jgi:3-methyladenine DNA glycosylase AlkD
MNVTAYCQKIHQLFGQHFDPENAAGQKAYMKGQFEYFGLKSAIRKELTRDYVKENGLPPKADLPKFVSQMWAFPQRELQYACIDILIKWKQKVGLDMLPVYQFMIEEKSWWDTVDLIASHLVGALVQNYPDLQTTLDAWSEADNMWLRRVAILHQLKYRDKVDEARLFSYCEKNMGDPEFFIRKAIGWALREYSKRNEEAVRGFVTSHPDLSGLSQREALKWLDCQR